MSDKPLKVIAIAAMDEARVIGLENGIPWHIPGEQKYFAHWTKGHTVLMGRKTYESLPEAVRPLPGRLSVVVSRSPMPATVSDNVIFASDPREAIEQFQVGTLPLRGDTLWIAGGQQIYEQTLDLWDEVFLTIVFGKHQGDAFFPELPPVFVCRSEEVHPTHKYCVFVRRQ